MVSPYPNYHFIKIISISLSYFYHHCFKIISGPLIQFCVCAFMWASGPSNQARVFVDSGRFFMYIFLFFAIFTIYLLFFLNFGFHFVFSKNLKENFQQRQCEVIRKSFFCDLSIFFLRMRQLFLAKDMIDIYCLVNSNLLASEILNVRERYFMDLKYYLIYSNSNKLSIKKIQWYRKSRIDRFEQNYIYVTSYYNLNTLLLLIIVLNKNKIDL